MNKKYKTNYRLQLRNVDINKRESIKCYNTSKNSKMKFKNLYRVGIMYDLKDKLSTD